MKAWLDKKVVLKLTPQRTAPAAPAPRDACKYRAFISYSHGADATFAPRLQSALHRFAKPWYRMRGLRTFRDQANLTANPDLWGRIQDALDSSEFLLFLASPEAARSPWTLRELLYWCERKDPRKILILLTDGHLEWDAARGDFDWRKTDTIPEGLRSRFGSQEPLYVDFRSLKREHLSPRHPTFLDKVASIAAELHGKEKDEIYGDDLRQHRRTQMISWLAVAALVLLLAAVTVAGFIAKSQRDEVRRTLSKADFMRADEYSKAGEQGHALAHLARAVRVDPEHFAAGSRLFFLLTDFDWLVEMPSSEEEILAFVPATIEREVDGANWTYPSDVPVDPARSWPFRYGRLINAALGPGAKSFVALWYDANENMQLGAWREGKQTFQSSMDELGLSPSHASFLGYSPDGSRILYCGGWGDEFGFSGHLILLDPWGWSRHFHSFDDMCRDAAFEPDHGEYFVTLTDKIELWDRRTGAKINDLGDSRRTRIGAGPASGEVAFHRDGELLRVKTLERQTHWRWVRTRPVVRRSERIPHDPLVADLSFIRQARDESFADERIERLDKLSGGIQTLDLHPNGQRALIADWEGRVSVWELDTLQRLFEPLQFNIGYVQAWLSPDGAFFITEEDDAGVGWGHVILWDTATGLALSEPMEQVGRGETPVTVSGMTRDGRRLVLAYGEANDDYSVHDIPYFPSPVPGWAADLAEALGGFRLDENSVLVRVRAEERVQAIERIRAASEEWTEPTEWETFGKWLVQDRETRSLSPFAGAGQP